MNRLQQNLARLTSDEFLATLAGNVLWLAINAGCRLTAWMAVLPGSGVTLWEPARVPVSIESDSAA